MNGQRGFSFLELFFVVSVIMIIAAVSLPNFAQSRMPANEASAISAVRHLVTAEISYATTIGSGYYGTLAALSGVGILDAALAGGSKHGYNFVVTPDASQNCTIVAIPISTGVSGQRSFYADMSGVIRYTLDGTMPTQNSPALD